MESFEISKHAVLKRVLHGKTRKKRVTVNAVNGRVVEVRQPYWDGGSRSEYCIVRAQDGQARRCVLKINPFPQPPATTEITLGPGEALLETGTFRGKPATPFLTIPREDLNLWTR